MCSYLLNDYFSNILHIQHVLLFGEMLVDGGNVIYTRTFCIGHIHIFIEHQQVCQLQHIQEAFIVSFYPIVKEICQKFVAYNVIYQIILLYVIIHNYNIPL